MYNKKKLKYKNKNKSPRLRLAQTKILWHVLDGFLCLWHTVSAVPDICMNDCD